jgi:hypothetical protein
MEEEQMRQKFFPCRILQALEKVEISTSIPV